MYSTKCRNCDKLWVEHPSDSHGPYCVRTYRPEVPPSDGTTERRLLKRPWLQTMTQRQITLVTRIAEAATMAFIISLLLAIMRMLG